MEDILKNISQLDDFFQNAGILKEDETIYQFFKKPYSGIEKIIIKYSHYPNSSPSDMRPIINLSFGLMILYSIEISSQDLKILHNIGKARKRIQEILIDLLHPKALNFFKWDLNRRCWEKHESQFQIEYISESIDEISNELKGNSKQLLDKYLPLIFEYTIFHFEKGLDDPENLKWLEGNDGQNELLYLEKINQFKELKNNIGSSNIDNEMREKFKNMYSQMAIPYLKGLLIIDGHFHFLVLSFIKAQTDFLHLLNSQLSILQKGKEKDFIKIKRLIENQNFDSFIKELKSIFATIPNVLIKNTTEAHYHIIIHVILKLIGCDFNSEINTNLGRIDGVLETDSHINVIEFKIGSADNAIDQILERKYYESYLNKEKSINLIGISFCKKERNIKDYKCLLNYKK